MALFGVLLGVAAFGQPDPAQLVRGVNAHVGQDAQTSVNITWVTGSQVASTSVEVRDAAGASVFSAADVSGTASGSEFSYVAHVTGLQPATAYTYTVKGPENEQQGAFRTASADPAAAVRFVYIADPQVARAADAAAAGSNFAYIAEEQDYDFLYIAGDHTDWNDSEAQWRMLFENGGAYAAAGRDMFLRTSVVSTQGNHDDEVLFHRIGIPTALGGGNEFTEGVYAVSHGVLRLVVLNDASYETTALAQNPEIQKQVEFLKAQVREARAAGQWVAVGFHKPIYTGASHISDGDVRDYRRFWNPIFTELDVDMVLGGHDHVYSRGFVDAAGKRASDPKDGESVPTYYHVPGAPLHMVAEHAGGLKWYKTVSYTVTPGDPIVEDYGFLDKNSASESPTSSEAREQTYVVVEVTADKAMFTAYKSKYDAATGARTKDKYQYDQFVVLKDGRVKNTQPTHTIAVDASVTGGTLEFAPASPVAEGSEVTVKIVPDAGKQLKAGTLQYLAEGTTAKTAIDENTLKFIMPAANVTVYAEFEAKPVASTKYTITFDSDGGSAVQPVTVEQGKPVAKPADPAKSGYTFIGWFNGATEYKFDTPLVSNLTLKAKWEKNTAVESLLLSGVRVLGNPLTELLVLDGVSNADRVDVYDVYGTTVYSRPLQGASRVEIAVEGWGDGVYIVRVVARDGEKTLRVVKM